ncbi:MAG: hypothetical protein JWP13_939, partial [Candidatus Saccharibacteria bacterium]|nr:hypothetical protein [Candidatus Saccharibacteria bacterium]
IIVPKVSDDTMRFTYDLKLPKSLQAKVIPDGNGAIGIYSADPMLFGDITYGSDADRTKVEQARENADKTFLVFGLPAPVVVAPKGEPLGNASARFELTGTTLTVVAEDLEGIDFPVSIDPSVVITSTTDFYTNGNDEGMIDFSVAGQITRGGLTGASVGSWTTSANTFTGNREKAGTIAYGGYLYIMGGSQRSPAVDYNNVQYAQINSSNGSLGAWQTTTNLPATYTDLTDNIGVYNGYLYIIGGVGPSATANTWYIPINANGSLGSTWTAGTPLWQNLAGAGTFAYRGFMYVLGGTDGFPGQCNTACLNTVRYASLNADGSLGAWTSTTSFATGRYWGRAIAHNGYIYIVGGAGSGGFLNSVEYAPINADGTLGTWRATTGFTSGRYGHVSYIYRGYIYVMGGWIGGTGVGYMNDVQYAQVNADGTVGDWETTTTFATGRNYTSGASWNGYLYVMGGYNPNSTPVNFNDTQYAKVDPPGMTTTSEAVTSLGVAANGVTAGYTVAANGYVYNLGGYQNGTGDYTNIVKFAPINADGTLGAWTTSTRPLLNASGAGAVAVYNNRIYVVGGLTTASAELASVQYAPLNPAGGELSAAWAATTALPLTMTNHTANAYNGYLYAFTNGGGGPSTTVYYAAIAANGTVGAWATTTSLNTSRTLEKSVVYGGYIYVVGGNNGAGTPTYFTSIEYAPVNANGTLGAWTTAANSMGTPRSRFALIANKGYLYAIGGETTGGVDLATTEYAKINTNGSIGTWTAGKPLLGQFANGGHDVFADKIYLISGRLNGTRSPTSNVVTINNGGNGAVGTWGATTALPAVRTHHASVIYGGYLYVTGGYGGTDNEVTTSQFKNDITYAKINADGTVGAWQAATSFTTARSGHSVIAYNGYMYILGGGSYTTANVFYNDV